MQPPRIGYVTAMWQRPELTNIIFSHVAYLKKQLSDRVDIVPVVSGSEGSSSRSIAEKNGFLYVEIPNAPLGAKWNAALGLLRDKDVIGACIFGSDDLANSAYFECLLKSLARGDELLGVDQVYFYEQVTGRMFHWKGYNPPRHRDTIGAGRFIHRRYIEEMGWKLWPDEQTQYLDTACFCRLKERYGTKLEFARLLPCNENIVIVDVKTAPHMTSTESLVAAGPTDIVGNPYAFIESHFGRNMAETLFPAATPRLRNEDSVVSEPWSNSVSNVHNLLNKNIVFSVAIEPKISSAARDALCAFRDAGSTVLTISPEEFLVRTPTPDDILYIQPVNRKEQFDCFTLLCSMCRQYRVIADCRVLPDNRFKERLYGLPVTILGTETPSGITASSLPHPFSVPCAPLAYDQRANAIAYVDTLKQMETLCTAYISTGLPELSLKLFFMTEDARLLSSRQFQHLGILFLNPKGLYDTRHIFRAALFQTGQYSPDLFLCLAAGTPAVYIGRPPLGLMPEQGVFSVQSHKEACALLRLLTSNPAFWQRASQGALTYAKERNIEFMQAFRAFQSEML